MSTETPDRIEIRREDECLTVLVDGVEVAEANHDDDGWAGMDRMESAVLSVARALTAPTALSESEAVERIANANERLVGYIPAEWARGVAMQTAVQRLNGAGAKPTRDELFDEADAVLSWIGTGERS